MFRDYTKYEVYDDGRIWSYKYKKFLKPGTTKNGYQFVILTDNEGKGKNYLLHRVVWESVTGEPIPEGMQVNHINECKTDNSFVNLNLMTPKENTNWGSGIERRSKSIKINKKLSKSLTNNPKISKSVGAYKDGELVMTFQSAMEAKRQGFNQGNVSACCRGERKIHKGYTWKYL